MHADGDWVNGERFTDKCDLMWFRIMKLKQLFIRYARSWLKYFVDDSIHSNPL